MEVALPGAAAADKAPKTAIKENVVEFLAYARANPNTQFFVTRIGCGLAKNGDEEIGPLFADAPPNCILPVDWKGYVSQLGIAPQGPPCMTRLIARASE